MLSIINLLYYIYAKVPTKQSTAAWNIFGFSVRLYFILFTIFAANIILLCLLVWRWVFSISFLTYVFFTLLKSRQVFYTLYCYIFFNLVSFP